MVGMVKGTTSMFGRPQDGSGGSGDQLTDPFWLFKQVFANMHNMYSRHNLHDMHDLYGSDWCKEWWVHKPSSFGDGFGGGAFLDHFVCVAWT